MEFSDINDCAGKGDSDGKGGPAKATLATKKTKWMYIDPEPRDHPLPELFIKDEQIERVHEFIYLGSLIGDSYSLGVMEDIDRRIAEATKIFGRLKPMWKSRKLPRSIKKRLFLVCVSTTLLYGCENWPLNSIASRKLNSFWYGKIRDVLGISWEKMRDERTRAIGHDQIDRTRAILV